MPTLTLTAATWAKQRPEQSDKLSDAEKVWMKAGEYPCRAYDDAEGGHVLVTLDPERMNLSELHNRNTWNFSRFHVEIEGNLPDNNPKDSAAPPAQKGRIVTIAGLGQRGLASPVDGCLNFTWAELTKGGSRLPENAGVSMNMVKITKALEEVRSRLGNRAITITSGYRPPAVNRAVGGASQSRHVAGDAIDFAVMGMRPKDVYGALNGWWGNRGGLAYGVGFCHIDARSYLSRWTYPGA